VYLNVPSSDISPNNVQLIFTFSPAVTTRTWNIKIAMLPCGATYLGNRCVKFPSKDYREIKRFLYFPQTAPADCLQYFSAVSGRVKSFNWMDGAGTATRQLNNQNYNICFRTELVSSQVCAILLLLDKSKSILQMNFQFVLNRRRLRCACLFAR
jgi:hypothetical protein